jgi:hypothetical protein
MTKIPLQINRGLAPLMVVFTTGCMGIVGDPASSGPQANRIESHAGQVTQANEKSPGLIVHINPKTGEIITPPRGTTAGQILQPPADASRKPPTELREALSPVPGGGVVMHLDDRFMSPLTATIDADGKIKLEHKQTKPGSDERQH